MTIDSFEAAPLRVQNIMTAGKSKYSLTGTTAKRLPNYKPHMVVIKDNLEKMACGDNISMVPV